MQGRGSGRVRDFALYGETTGETDEFGLPVRYDWAADYRGRAMVVYGHTPVPSRVAQQHDLHRHRLRLRRRADGAALSRRRSWCRSRRRATYYAPLKPLRAAGARWRRLARRSRSTTTCWTSRTCSGRRVADHALLGNVIDPRGPCGGGPGGDEPLRRRPALADLPAANHVAVRDQSASRGCWSIPRRRSPTTAARAWRRSCVEEKHMGSRAVVVVCRDELPSLRARFGIARTRPRRWHRATRGPGGASSTIARSEPALLAAAATGRWSRGRVGRARDGLAAASTAELMPWSAKAQELLRQQYAAVGAAARRPAGGRRRARAGIGAWAGGWRVARERPLRRRAAVSSYVEAYRRYCWPVDGRSTICAWRPSTCWPAKAPCTSTRTTSGTCRRSPALCRRRSIACCSPRRIGWSISADP